MSDWRKVKKKRKGGGVPRRKKTRNMDEYLMREKMKKKDEKMLVEKKKKDDEEKDNYLQCWKLLSRRKEDIDEFSRRIVNVSDVNRYVDENNDPAENEYTIYTSLLYTAIKRDCKEIVDILLSHPEIDTNIGMEQKEEKEKYESYSCYNFVKDSNLTCAVRLRHLDIAEKLINHPSLNLKECYSTSFYEGGCSGTWTVNHTYLYTVSYGQFEQLFSLVRNRHDFDPNSGLISPGFPQWACCSKNYQSPLDMIVLQKFGGDCVNNEELKKMREAELIKEMLPLLNHPKCDVNMGFDDIYRGNDIRMEVQRKEEEDHIGDHEINTNIIFPVAQHAMEMGYYEVLKILMMYGTDKTKMMRFHDTSDNYHIVNLYNTNRVKTPEEMKDYVKNYPHSFNVMTTTSSNVKFFSKRFKDFAILLLLCFEKGKFSACTDTVFIILSFVNETWFGKDGKYKPDLI